MGYTACQNAQEKDFSQGNIGVGCGATVGKITGMENSMPGGVGQASVQLEGGCIVSALVVVNALGDVIDPQSNAILAGARDKSTGEFINTMAFLKTNASKLQAMWGGNTTLAVVATNANLTKVQAAKVAQMAHDGFARAINPVHTKFDGDTIFAMSCGNLEVDEMILGAVAAEVVAESIINAVHAANPQHSPGPCGPQNQTR